METNQKYIDVELLRKKLLGIDVDYLSDDPYDRGYAACFDEILKVILSCVSEKEVYK